ncbi:lantibiotic dehydratase family protein [Sinomicrobium weinanense]|uniref:Lantibiotic dehydratase family protein n=1 Tax=Sinomicrobium weinanense TaxID=2842200 RepID=A0A926JU87_9FLAO|nr:lantibiotic dehydratase family protein [Sinomicrobium weinanense]MBC9797627.1 lantibiotic dehydratase family protein [Sinomicrobium weinanense]MBU3125247.1 lantibiotic dehydratase family protein [Sinomicrobium weinanense]
MNKNPYKHFPNYVLRTPLFAVDFYKDLTAEKDIPDEKLKECFKDLVIQEAVFLASPPLYEELNRWANGEAKDPKKTEKLKYSFLKYLSRMSSRCTPFGLFAGCTVGGFGEGTEIKLRGARNNRRHTRLDMNYLVALSQDLVKNKNIREQLLFFPNSSIYRAGDQLRYIEYKYVNSKRHHHIVAVDDSEYLSGLLEKAAKGESLKNLSEALVDDEITYEEAAGFIEELVESQLLISELEPSVSGPEFLEQIREVLEKLEGTKDVLDFLNRAGSQIEELDQGIGNPPESYVTLSEFLKQLETSFELKYLFQTDMILETEKNILDKTVVDAVKKGLCFLNKVTLPPKKTLLDQFKTAFYERFEEREVPLSMALDVEMGIGYKQDQGTGDVNPLVDDLILPGKKLKHQISEVKWSPVHSVLQQKLVQALARKDYCINLQGDDFKDFDENWEDLPDTISTMIEVVEEDGEIKIKLGGAGGSSAANLLGRFCHGDEKLDSHTRKVIDTEARANNGKVLAEIVHLPESRVGNILMRPAFRHYEIPYLAKSVLPGEQQLPIEDLRISVKYGTKVRLRSGKLDKEVIPHLTNAHNYSTNSLPIYHFLCDMQTQGLRGGVGLNLGPFADEYTFIPRITYQNLIFSEATWNLATEDIEPLKGSIKEDKKLEDAVENFRKKRKIPQYVMLTDGDNELLINFKNLTSVRMLLDTVKKRQRFKLTEFFFGKGGIVKDDRNAYYANQIVLSFYNSQRLKDEE